MGVLALAAAIEAQSNTSGEFDEYDINFFQQDGGDRLGSQDPDLPVDIVDPNEDDGHEWKLYVNAKPILDEENLTNGTFVPDIDSAINDLTIDYRGAQIFYVPTILGECLRRKKIMLAEGLYMNFVRPIPKSFD